MPTEPVDEFDALFPEALKAASDMFSAPSGDLIERGIRRGRRMRRARIARTSAVAASLVLIVTGGALAGSRVFTGAKVQTASTPTPTAKASASSTPSASAGISGQSMISTLEGLLPPGGTFTETYGRGTETLPNGSARPYASVVYHGSGGVSGIEVDLSRFAAGTPVTSTEYSSCPSAIDNPYSVCSARTQSDGSLLVVDEDFTRPQANTGQRIWSVVLIRTDGAMIQVSEYGGGAEKSSTSSVKPVLSTDSLAAIARSAAWQPALALMKPPARATATTSPPGMANAKISSILTSLLPHGVAISSQGGQTGFAEFVLDDGHGKSALEINVQQLAGLSMDCASHTEQGATCSASTLPDGTQELVTQGPSSQRAGSVTRWAVDTLRPNGLRVVVFEFNAASVSGPVTRATPALTIAQLQQIATSALWAQ
jgi:hypothetical protein